MKDTNMIVLAVLGAIVIGTAGFMAGRHMNAGFGKGWAMGNQQAGFRAESGGGRMMKGDLRGQGRMGGAGEITKVEGTTVTLKLQDGTTKEVTLSSTATVRTMTEGSMSDLKPGQTIMVAGGGFWSDGETVIVKP